MTAAYKEIDDTSAPVSGAGATATSILRVGNRNLSHQYGGFTVVFRVLHQEQEGKRRGIYYDGAQTTSTGRKDTNRSHGRNSHVATASPTRSKVEDELACVLYAPQRHTTGFGNVEIDW